MEFLKNVCVASFYVMFLFLVTYVFSLHWILFLI